jgi:hypothetical protein
MSRVWRIPILAAAVLLSIPAVGAEETRITVRILSKDAKFIGTSMGGARVVIRDVESGEILAQGLTRGGTGDTDLIMREDWQRHRPISSEGAAAFTAVIDLDEPRRLEVSAYGPLGQLQSANRVSATQWVVPGKHIEQGDAWLLVMPGFSVDLLAPAPAVKLKGVPREVVLEANLTLM